MLERLKKFVIRDSLNKSDFKKVIYSRDIKKNLRQFKIIFSLEISNFIDSIFNAYKSWKIIDKKCKGDKQKSYVAGYLLNAINNLVVSLNFLILGHLDASGNLFRQFMESSAMSILLSSQELNYFEMLMEHIEKKTKFEFHRSLDFVSDNIGKLKIDRNAWNKFKKIRNFYHSYSHASLLSVAGRFNFDVKDTVYIGGNYDPAKVEIYRKEIQLRISAADSLKNIIEGITAKASIFV